MQHRHSDLTQGITEALAAAVQRARAIHKALGQPIVIWREGRVQWVDAETLEEVPAPAAEPVAGVVREPEASLDKDPSLEQKPS